MAKADAKQKNAAKGKKDKKGKKGGAAPSGASVASHPRAAAAVRRAKGVGGLVGFALAALISRKAGISHTQMLERALIAGVVGYLLVWACAVAVWRHIVIAEMRAAHERRINGSAVARAARAPGRPVAADAAAAASKGAPSAP